jgi:hypothetical protein
MVSILDHGIGTETHSYSVQPVANSSAYIDGSGMQPASA